MKNSFLLAFAEFAEGEALIKHKNKKSSVKSRQSNNFQASKNSFYSQSTDSQSCEGNDLGTHILKDLAKQWSIYYQSIWCDLLPNGGENFNWHEYCIQSIGESVLDIVSGWVESVVAEKDKHEYAK